MSETTDVTEAPVGPQPSRKKRNLIVGGVAVIVAAGIAVGTWLAVGGSSGTPAASSTAKTDVSGTVVIFVPDFEDQTTGSSTDVGAMSPGDPCAGTGKYAGVDAGLTIAITGPSGQTLAQIPLEAGAVGNDSATGIAACTFPWYGSVPENAGTYTVAVGSFATKTYTLSQLKPVTISLAD